MFRQSKKRYFITWRPPSKREGRCSGRSAAILQGSSEMQDGTRSCARACVCACECVCMRVHLCVRVCPCMCACMHKCFYKGYIHGYISRITIREKQFCLVRFPSCYYTNKQGKGTCGVSLAKRTAHAAVAGISPPQSQAPAPRAAAGAPRATGNDPSL